MPLAKIKKSKNPIGSEIKHMQDKGKPHDQAVAIALSEARHGDLGKKAKKTVGKYKK